VNCTVELGEIILQWINETNTFSISYDPNSYATLHSYQKTVISSTSIKLTWGLSLDDKYPLGTINVVEANTKVYDIDDLYSSGSHSNLFYFEGEEEQGSTTNPSFTPSADEVLVEKVVAPAVFGVTDNMIAIILLAVIAILSGLLWRWDYPTASKILFGGFVFLAFNFAISYVMIPLNLLPDFMSFLEPLVLKAPTLQLSSFTVEEQNIIQILFLSASLPIAGFVVYMFTTNQGEL